MSMGVTLTAIIRCACAKWGGGNGWLWGVWCVRREDRVGAEEGMLHVRWGTGRALLVHSG